MNAGAPKSSDSQPSQGNSYPFPEEQEEEDRSDTDEPAFEGNSSLHVHSAEASNVFEKAVQGDSSVDQNPEMVDALASLKELTSRQELHSRRRKLGTFGYRQVPKALLHSMELPPVHVVLSLLRSYKGKHCRLTLQSINLLLKAQARRLCVFSIPRLWT